MNDWEKLNEALPEKNYFLVKMEYITDADYTHRNRVCKDFKIKKIR